MGTTYITIIIWRKDTDQRWTDKTESLCWILTICTIFGNKIYCQFIIELKKKSKTSVETFICNRWTWLCRCSSRVLHQMVSCACVFSLFLLAMLEPSAMKQNECYSRQCFERWHNNSLIRYWIQFRILTLTYGAKFPRQIICTPQLNCGTNDGNEKEKYKSIWL